MNPTLKFFTPTHERELAALPLDLDEPGLTDANLVPTIAVYAAEWTRRANIELDFYQMGVKPICVPLSMTNIIYTALQLLLENVRLHSDANYVTVILEQRAGFIQLTVDDDGHGFDVEAVRTQNEGGASGLLEIEMQATLTKGIFRIESGGDKGTTAFLKIPLREMPQDALQNN